MKTLKIRSKIIKTKRGSFKTPFFMPDATRGFIKSVSNKDLRKINMGPMVVNTYHLCLQPGMERIKKAGGINKFMNWNGPLLSDSGGFQVFSLIHKNPAMGKITEEGVVFKSPLDGSRRELTPEKSIQIQFDLGVDMMVCFDDCPPNDYKKEELDRSVERTIRWAKRCAQEYDRLVKKYKSKNKKYIRPLIFSVIQGGAYRDLRKKCYDGLAAAAPRDGWDGYGFGARPVDAEGNFLGDILKYTANLIPEDKLRFALGIGTPEDIRRCVKMGWDMFDCVIPTREGRHGKLFFFQKNNNFQFSIFNFQLNNKSKRKFYYAENIPNAKFSTDFSPINRDSKLSELREHSKSYLYHLLKLKEPLGQRLCSLNNLEFYLNLMKRLKN